MLTTEELEKLIVSFDAAAIAVEQLVKSTKEILEENKIFKAKINEKAFLSLLDKDILSTLHEQKMINKSLSYMLMADAELIDEIIKMAQKNNDKEVLSYWFKKRNL